MPDGEIVGRIYVSRDRWICSDDEERVEYLCLQTCYDDAQMRDNQPDGMRYTC